MATAKIENISELQKDIQALKADIKTLTKHATNEGHNNFEELKEKAMTNIAHLKDYGSNSVERLEKEVKAKPGQSLAVAFGAGVIASLLLRKW